MNRSRSRSDRVLDVLGQLGIGLAIGGLTSGLALALWATSPPSPFLLFYPAVVLAAWWGGRISGVTTLLVSSLALAYYFLPPSTSLAVAARRDALDLVIYCVVSLLLTHFITRARGALRAAREALRQAEAATAAKETVL